jgi:hypothetical protein
MKGNCPYVHFDLHFILPWKDSPHVVIFYKIYKYCMHVFQSIGMTNYIAYCRTIDL